VTECEAGQTPPRCTDTRTTSSLAIVNTTSGADTIVPGTALGRDHDIQAPSWEPDGTRIRFSAYEPSTDRSTAYIVSADGGDLTKIVDGAIVAWSPDGRWFLARFGTEAVYIGSVDGGPLRELGTFTAVDW
jgi:Tol biopolymer transport system component